VKFLTDEQFVTAWATSKSLDEVAKKTKLVKISVQARASRLRKLGVKLAKFSRRRKIVDVDKLNKLLKRLQK
jgi:hypothetical protein